ncbi:hypothetical protein [Candidatus Mycoplasma haematohominis]|uniref:Uncharacterized protein n=1 Tax=Candidatus Mycoplasma haematohominis TaxID=1494318 RepID=A0A478FQC9_9MOLU|nr:hypothetical protein [Candidatus Mycoplasma haemohominis]GCE63104.1 hypothetical protein MHSWG343_00820 [Candidatus Mycoplasma haemohominis]
MESKINLAVKLGSGAAVIGSTITGAVLHGNSGERLDPEIEKYLNTPFVHQDGNTYNRRIRQSHHEKWFTNEDDVDGGTDAPLRNLNDDSDDWKRVWPSLSSNPIEDNNNAEDDQKTWLRNTKEYKDSGGAIGEALTEKGKERARDVMKWCQDYEKGKIKEELKNYTRLNWKTNRDFYGEICTYPGD